MAPCHVPSWLPPLIHPTIETDPCGHHQYPVKRANFFPLSKRACPPPGAAWNAAKLLWTRVLTQMPMWDQPSAHSPPPPGAPALQRYYDTAAKLSKQKQKSSLPLLGVSDNAKAIATFAANPADYMQIDT